MASAHESRVDGADNRATFRVVGGEGGRVAPLPGFDAPVAERQHFISGHAVLVAAGHMARPTAASGPRRSSLTR